MRKHGWFRPHVRGLTAISSTTLREGGGDIITSIFADGTDGFYFDFSKTDRLFQNLTGTPADGAGENIYLGYESHAWSGRDFAAQLAAETAIVSDSFAYADDTALRAVWKGWTSATTSDDTLITLVSGKMRVTSNANGRGVIALTGLTVGADYVAGVDYAAVSHDVGYFRIGTQSAGQTATAVANYDLAGTGDGTKSLAFRATATTMYASCWSNTATAGRTVDYDNFTLRRVSGNHGLQATTAAQPKWQTGGLARFDGSDDNLLTTLVPGTSMTLMVKMNATAQAAKRIALGSQSATANSSAYLGIGSAGGLRCAIGGTPLETVSSISGAVCVGAVVGNGSNIDLYLNGVPAASGSPLAAINTSIPVSVGAFNNNGTLSSFLVGDIYYALAIKKALTAAQIAAITTKWGTS